QASQSLARCLQGSVDVAKDSAVTWNHLVRRQLSIAQNKKAR
ncbi:hypothetical protein J2W27_005563, partial [Variovorax boronicumulans]|nr:hypothetical protein [Variovorax boronicumulans]